MVSLRSNKTSRLWLRVKQSRIQGNVCASLLIQIVEPLNKGHIESKSTTPCREADLSQKINQMMYF